MRTYVSGGANWELAGVPTPFGKAPSSVSNIAWWHNFYAFVHIHGDRWTVRDTDGTALHFKPCSGVSCWANQFGNREESRERLQRTATGFALVRPNGSRLVFDATWASTANTIDRYFLTRIESSSGLIVAELAYQSPTTQAVTCPGGAAGTDPGVPYISTVTASGGTQLQFSYEHVGVGNNGTECVLIDVHRSGAAGGPGVTQAATFTYTSLKPGLIESVTKDDGIETYAYGSSTFTQTLPSGTSFTHTYANDRVTNSRAPELGEDLHVTYLPDEPCPAQGGCCGQRLIVRSVADHASGRGDGLPVPDGGVLTEEFRITQGFGDGVGERLFKRTDNCSIAGACSPGTVEYDWACGTDAGPGYLRAEKNKRGHWTVKDHANVATDAGVFLEHLATHRGAADSSGANALHVEEYDYRYSGDNQLLHTTYHQSTPSRSAGTRHLYGPNGRPAGEIRFGQAALLNGSTAPKYVGTFWYECEDPVAGSCQGQEDAFGNVRSVHGPCFVSGLNSTHCDGAGGNYPVTKYSYFGGGVGDNSHRLSQVTREVAGQVLTTSFNNYDSKGNPREITDENGILTRLTYDPVTDQVASRKVALGGTAGTADTYLSYAGGKVSSIQHPEGNYEVFCYRSGTSAGGAGCAPTAALTHQLQWRAKAGDALGVAWSEQVKFTYWPDGTLKNESYYDSSAPTVARRERVFAADAHRRPTYEGTGTSTGLFASVSAYDRADNLMGVGHAYNSPPAWCMTPNQASLDEPTSKLCSWLGYDAADRLTKLTEHSTDSEQEVTRLAYDRRGNICAITTGASAAWSVNSDCSSTGANDHPSTTYYRYDDFRNLREVHAPFADNGSSGHGVTRYQYDAQGAVVLKQTEAMRQRGEWLEYGLDALGRLTSATAKSAATAQLLYSYTYDTSSMSPACLGLPQLGASSSADLNVRGRLATRHDSFGLTHYAYDALGRVVAEVRQRNGAGTGACTGLPNYPHTFYGWDKNGNPTHITYPHGRTVSYAYGTGGLRDRVSSVGIETHDGSAWHPSTPINQVVWEPYGGLRGYRLHLAGLRSAAVEYMLGDNASDAIPESCSTVAPNIINGDKTGRLRSLRVTSFASPRIKWTPGQGSGDIFKQWYRWKADQVSRVETCLLGTTTARVEDYTYARNLRLTSATNNRSTADNDSYSALTYGYSARGNRVTHSENDFGSTHAYAGTDRLSARESLTLGTALRHAYAYDRDGRVTSKSWSWGGQTHSFGHGFGSVQSSLDTVFKSVSISAPGFVNSVAYSYFYDSLGRRRGKQYPITSAFDEYFHGLDDRLLTDQGNEAVIQSTYRTVDDYVWLDGRPVAMARGRMSSSWARAADTTTTCNRNGEFGACGIYYPITDHIGRPVVMLNSARQVVGTGEYDPFGNMNRVVSHTKNAAPHYPLSTFSIPVGSFQQPTQSNVDLELRVDFHATDVYSDGQCSSADVLQVTDDATQTPLWSTNGSQGRRVTPWLSPTQGGIDVSIFSGCQDHQSGFFCTCRSTPVAKGAVVEAYEFRRRQSGTSGWFFTPLRFPGQYFDAETGLHENWNRYYDPSIGRYLQPEPKLENPSWVKAVALEGLSPPVYSYALNNPMHFTDPDGRDPAARSVACGFAVVQMMLRSKRTPGDDKYLHCKTMCYISQICDGYPGLGEMSATANAYAGEAVDFVLKAAAGQSRTANWRDAVEDMDANRRGIGHKGDCHERCKSLLPDQCSSESW